MLNFAENNGRYDDGIDRRLSVAPMMDWTDRHCRYFHRLLAPHALLFTEMVTAEAILHAGPERFCAFHGDEHPLALQLGGSDPRRLAEAVSAVAPFQFDEINLNVGCPSDRVQSGRFGACLMAEPELVADCLDAMQSACDLPISVKCRIGIDDMDEEEGLNRFISAVEKRGIKLIYLHARKAWLNGLSPKENRDIPPLNYDRAARLRRDFPSLQVFLNGGLTTTAQITDEAPHFDGVMIGRAAYKTPYFLAELSQQIWSDALPDRLDIAARMTSYAASEMEKGVRLHSITRHILGLMAGQKGAKIWRRTLGEDARIDGQSPALIQEVMKACLEMADSEKAA